MTADQFIKARIVQFCLEEKYKSGDDVNMAAIAFVLRNRVDAGWHGGDWMRVIEQAYDLRPAPKPRAWVVDLKDATVRNLFRFIDEIYDGSAEDETNGALYYADLHVVTNPRIVAIVRDLENHPRRATIGTTAFFG